MPSQRARPIIKGPMSHEVRLSSLGLQQPGQISIHRIRPRTSSETSGRWMEGRSRSEGQGQHLTLEKAKIPPGTHSPITGPIDFFCPFLVFLFFASSVVHKIPLKVHWDLSYNMWLIMWERGECYQHPNSELTLGPVTNLGQLPDA